VSENTGASGSIDSGRVSVYGGGYWGPSVLAGTAGYAYDRISTARPVTSVGTATEGHDGHEFSVAGQWSLPMAVTGVAGPATVTPTLGARYLHLSESGFRETGVGNFAVSSTGNGTDSLQPFISLVATESFLTNNGSEITPELRVGYSREALSNNRAITVAATDGTPFVVSGLKPSRDMLTAGIGLKLRAQHNVLLYASYDAIVPIGNTTQHTVSAGVRIRF
jgi:fibronectin-binding autotransporter adhesin